MKRVHDVLGVNSQNLSSKNFMISYAFGAARSNYLGL